MFVEKLFVFSCKIGSLSMVRWVERNYPNVDISANQDEAFLWACSGGHVELAKHLYNASVDKHRPIDVSFDNERVFRMACANGHLPMVKWLIRTKPYIDISALDEYAFYHAGGNNHLPIVWWFHCQNQQKYQFMFKWRPPLHNKHALPNPKVEVMPVFDATAEVKNGMQIARDEDGWVWQITFYNAMPNMNECERLLSIANNEHVSLAAKVENRVLVAIRCFLGLVLFSTAVIRLAWLG